MSLSTRVWLILDRVALVALLVASFGVIWKIGLFRDTPPPSLSVAGTSTFVPPKPSEFIAGRISPSVFQKAAMTGSSQAKAVIVEFSDYQCPFCARFARDLYPELRREFIDTGKVRYVIMNFPLEMSHPEAMAAALAVECARSQGKFWQMRDALFLNQHALKNADVTAYAKSVGIDLATFQSCTDRQLASAIVEAQREEASRLGVSATPTFLVGSVHADGTIDLSTRIVGAQSLEVFRSAIAEIVGRTRIH